MSCRLLDRALLHAVATNDIAAVERLLAEGASPNVRDEESATALMRAAEAGHASVVQRLLARGADSRLVDRWGNTAAMRAAREGHSEIGRWLDQAGSGETPNSGQFEQAASPEL